MDYNIILDSFEGPLDLLLNLIDKAKVDIYDIPIVDITNQYMEYIYTIEELNLDLASEFILMAATLLEIKSKMLLPSPKKEDEEDEVDPREDLVQRLLAYKKYKDAANKLREYEEYELKAYYKPKEDLSIYDEGETFLEQLDLDILVESINNILEERGYQKEILDLQEIRKDEYSVKECSANIIDALSRKDEVKFTDLLREKATRNEIVTYFMALLELIKVKMINVKQDKDFTDLLITEQE